MVMSALQKLRMLVGCIALALSIPLAAQQSRQVIVNGVLLNKSQLQTLDSLNCGATVPNGNFWLKATGAWGYPGGGQEGVIGEECAKPSAPPKPSGKSECEKKYRYHEDRMCYCYNVC